ncbi:MAG: lytic transglycosylase domain-containing protein, partial [Asticcacaulis sp.]
FLSRVSASVLAATLLALGPDWAVSVTASVHKAHAASDNADTRASARHHTTVQVKEHKSAEADDDDDAPAKPKAHAPKVAAADDAKLTKSSRLKLRDAEDEAIPAHGKKTSRVAETSEDDDDAPAAKSAHGKQGKLRLAEDDDAPVHGKSGAAPDAAHEKAHKAHGRTELADDDAPAKPSKAHGRKTETIDDGDDAPVVKAAIKTPAAKPVAAPAAAPTKIATIFKAPAVTLPAPVATALTQTARAAAQPINSLAAVTSAISRLPQSLFADPGGAPNAPAPQAAQPQAPAPALPAVPVAYASIAAQSANSHGALSASDAQLYQTAFAQIDSGDFDGAEATLTQVSDKSLSGYVEYHKLFHAGYNATYGELTAWLSQYGDQPMAMKVWSLAKRKKPEGAPDPAYPSLAGAQALAAVDGSGNVVALAASVTLDDTPSASLDVGAPRIDSRDSDLTPKSARSAYNNGQFEQAVTLARKIGDHWVAGLANWRLKRYDAALTEFQFVSNDPSRDAWSQSGGAYWAGRCADKLGQKDQSDTLFKIAASFPFTFYGLLAEQRLGVTPAVILSKRGEAPTFQPDNRQVLTASLSDDFAWTKTNPQAQRLNALVQIGRAQDAQIEAQSAVQRAGDGAERDHWLALAAYNHVGVSQLHTSDRLFNPAIYPTPNFKLKGGFKVDKALLFAFARKESKFNATAKSYAGAYGLLQMMPSTAALIENNPKFNSKPALLFKPAVNLRVGQEYMQRLLDSKVVNGDLIRMIAAYNGGPGPVKDAMESLGGDAKDSVLFMESIPVAETRQYVEEVAANYWIYCQLMGKPAKSLAQV